MSVRRHGGTSTVLRKFQADFVDAVAGARGDEVYFLRADVGLGKTLTLSRLVQSVLASAPRSRVLILSPLALLMAQWAQVLGQQGVSCSIVDGYWLREQLVARGPGEDLWQSGNAYAVSVALAKRPDVAELLGCVQWDLVVADDGDSLSSAKSMGLRELLLGSRRAVVTAGTHVASLPWIPAARVQIVEWRLDQLAEAGLVPVQRIPRPSVEVEVFMTTPAEALVAEGVAVLSQAIVAKSNSGRLVGFRLIQAFESSPCVLESFLRKYIGSGAEPASEADGLSVATDSGDPRALAGPVLAQVEECQADSKLDRLIEFVRGLSTTGSHGASVFVVTEYKDTLFYLVAALEEAGLACSTLHGGMDGGAVERAISSAIDGVDIVVATRAVLADGLPLHSFDNLVIYDIPPSPVQMARVVGVFDRIGRDRQLSLRLFVRAGSGMENVIARFAAEFPSHGWDRIFHDLGGTWSGSADLLEDEGD